MSYITYHDCFAILTKLNFRNCITCCKIISQVDPNKVEKQTYKHTINYNIKNTIVKYGKILV